MASGEEGNDIFFLPSYAAHFFFFKFLGSCSNERLQAMESNKIGEHM